MIAQPLLPAPLQSVQPNDPDGPLVLAAVDGDVSAFGLLVERLQGRVFSFLVRQVKIPADAEDLTQDTLLEAHRKIGSFKGQSKFSTWVLGIALNMARNYRRRTPQYRHAHVSEDDAPESEDRRADPYRDLETTDFARFLQDAMNQLPDDVREALVLVSLEGLGYQDAAEVIGVPVGTVKTRVFRARKILREIFKKQGKESFLTP